MSWIYYIQQGGLSNQSEIINNTDIMYDYFINQAGSTLEAFCGFLGNVYSESGYNPGNMETLGNFNDGLGLIQWTKSSEQTQNPLLDWTQDMGYNWYDGDRQMWLVLNEHNIGAWSASDVHPEYNYTWEQFLALTDVATASACYMWQRERPDQETGEARLGEQNQVASEWYTYYSGHPPTPPTPPTPIRKKKTSIAVLICGRGAMLGKR